MEKKLNEYVEKIISKIFPQWLMVPAHTLYYGYPEQSLFWHAVNATMIGNSILDYFEKFEGELIADWRKLSVFLTFHDLDRYLQIENPKNIIESQVRESLVGLNLDMDEFCPDLAEEELTWLIRNHHLFSRGNALEGKHLGNKEMFTLLKLCSISDGLSAITTPRKAFIDPNKPSDRIINNLFTSLFKGYQLGHHEINYIAGYSTNMLHATVAELLREVDERICPLCYFPNGYIYIFPDEVEEKVRSLSLSEIVRRFMTKFQTILTQTRQVTASQKNTVSGIKPASFAFLIEPDQILEFSLDWIFERYDKEQNQKKQINGHITDYVNNHDVAKPYQRLCRDLDKLADEFSEASKIKKDGSLIEFRSLFVYLSFVYKLLHAYYPKKADEKFAKLIDSDYPSFSQFKGEKGDKDRIGLFGAVIVWNRIRNNSQQPESPEAFLQELSLKSRDVKDVIKDLGNRAKSLITDVTVKEKLYALSREGILTEDNVKLFSGNLADNDPAIHILTGEFTNILAEYIALLDQHYPFIATRYEKQCNICGRFCSGIELSAPIAAGSKVKTYSGYNMQLLIDSNPRHVCALCFFENVLRRTICGQGDDPLYLFIFPEYVFSPYHTTLFKSEIFNRLVLEAEESNDIDFGIADEEESEMEEEEDIEEEIMNLEESALLRAIQELIFKSNRHKEMKISDTEIITPVLVIPYKTVGENVSLIEIWTQLFNKYLGVAEK